MLVEMLLAPTYSFFDRFQPIQNPISAIQIKRGAGALLYCEGVSVMDNLSDMLVGKQRPEGNGPTGTKIDFMNMRKVQSVDGLTEKIVANPPSEKERGIDRLIKGLVDLLPKPDGIWRVEDRVKWLRLAADIFDLGYKANDGQSVEISIVALKQVPANPPTS